jgi:3-hydroxypropanoate dehydrogenase
MQTLDGHALDLIFRDARTYSKFLPKPVPPEVLEQVYDIAKWGPTSMNCCPMRIAFVVSPEAKEKLKPCLSPGNVEKTMAAPVTAVLAYDHEFFHHMSDLWPHSNAMEVFDGKPELAQETAFRNGTLQAAYFMIAARSLGLACGPMSGFHKDLADEAFFAGTPWKSNFLCNLGYGDPSKLYPRNPRPEFSSATVLL